MLHLNVLLPAPARAVHRDLAVIAERGLFDSVLLPDSLAASDRPDDGGLEPLTLLAALAGATHRIGLIASASTTFYEPYILARTLASLDHISRGRAGWDMATSGSPAEARNFCLDEPVDAEVRAERAAEFLDVVTQLWDSRSDDRLRTRAVAHTGLFFKVAGPLNVPRPPQGWPLLVYSEGDPEFAARYAEVLVTPHRGLADAAVFARDVKARAAAYGRYDGPLVLPTVMPAGGAARIADGFEAWYEAGAADGFTIAPRSAAELAGFVDSVVPVLQQRGLFRTAYGGRTLRDHYGLERPVDYYPEAVSALVA